jgi:TatD DNase family protein
MATMPRGQFHCFSYDEEALQEVLGRGFYCSFCGNITWSKRVAKLVTKVPHERLLLETDSPLMMPRDNKGQPIDESMRNEPKNVTMLAALQAEMKNQPIEQFARQTTANAIKLYGIR